MNIFDKIFGIFSAHRPDDTWTVAPGEPTASEVERGRRYAALKQQLSAQLSQPRASWRPALANMAARADLVVVNQAVTPAALAEWLAFVGPRVPADAQGWFAVLELRARGPQAAAAQAAVQQAAPAQMAAAQAASAQGEGHVPVPATSGMGNYVRGW